MLALGITREQNGVGLLDGALTLRERAAFGGCEKFEIDVSRRIGIRAAAELPLRFCVRGSKCLSRKLCSGEGLGPASKGKTY